MKQRNHHSYNGEDDEIAYDNRIEDNLIPLPFSDSEFSEEKGDDKPNDQYWKWNSNMR